jgi:predicted anti-sigma-YlaC factor YlaD
MDCKMTQANMDERLDGRLDAARRAAFDAHVAGCAACASQWRAQAGLWAALGAEKGVEPSFGFVERTLRRLDEPVAAPAGWRLPVWRWAAAACLLVAATSGWLAWHHVQRARQAEVYAWAQQDRLEDFDVIASLDQLNGGKH